MLFSMLMLAAAFAVLFGCGHRLQRSRRAPAMYPSGHAFIPAAGRCPARSRNLLSRCRARAKSRSHDRNRGPPRNVGSLAPRRSIGRTIAGQTDGLP